MQGFHSGDKYVPTEQSPAHNKDTNYRAPFDREPALSGNFLREALFPIEAGSWQGWSQWKRRGLHKGMQPLLRQRQTSKSSGIFFKKRRLTRGISVQSTSSRATWM